MIFKILNPLFNIGFYLLFLILLWTSSRVIISNISYLNVIKTGKITEIEYERGSQSDHGKGVYNNKVLTTDNQIVYGGTQNQYTVGDAVTLRYTGKVPSKIFEINGKKIASKYDIWDWLSPILFMFCIFMLYRLTKMWISRLRGK